MDSLQGKRILVIDDEPTLLRILEQMLTGAEAEVYTASSGPEGLRHFYNNQPDLVIVDLMMPHMDGWEVCRSIRQLSDVPLIMLTALSRDKDVVRGLACGADDYVVKPFSSAVLLARVKAALRRTMPRAEPRKPKVYHDGYLTIDLDRRRVLVKEKPVKLSATEYRLLTYLFQNAGRILTSQQILTNVWGEEYLDNTDYVHVYISHLRRKLEADPSNPVYLQTEFSVGYRFEKQASQ